MKKIIDISERKLDTNRLISEIQHFLHENSCMPYLFASTKTIKALEKADDDFATTGKFDGAKVYTNVDLDFGEFELR